jgi:hypothetical protein
MNGTDIGFLYDDFFNKWSSSVFDISKHSEVIKLIAPMLHFQLQPF